MASRNKASRILVFRGGALGDFLLTLPAIAALRRRFPGAYIELAGYPPSAGLALMAGLVNRVQSLDSARMALYFQKEIKLLPDEIQYIHSFDLIVSYLHDPDGTLLGHLEESGAKNIIVASPLVSKCHAADHFYNAIKDIVGDKFEQPVTAKPWSHFIKCDHGSIPPVKQFQLKWPQSLKEKARGRLFDYSGGKQAMIIHPGSGSPAKNWPAEKFALLAKKIRNETSFEPIIIGGEADEKAIASMRLLLPGFHFLIKMPLTDATSILSAAAGFVGNDSGLTHLAAVLGIPVVALFGPTDPEIWAPRGKNVCVIKSCRMTKESLAEIRVDEVFHKLREALDGGKSC